MPAMNASVRYSKSHLRALLCHDVLCCTRLSSAACIFSSCSVMTVCLNFCAVCLSLLLYCMSICLSVLLSVSVVFTHSEIEPSAACHNVLRLMVCRRSPARTTQNHPTTPANVEHIRLSPKHQEITIITPITHHTTPHHTLQAQGLGAGTSGVTMASQAGSR
jgi:hypothetical protein